MINFDLARVIAEEQYRDQIRAANMARLSREYARGAATPWPRLIASWQWLVHFLRHRSSQQEFNGVYSHETR